MNLIKSGTIKRHKLHHKKKYLNRIPRPTTKNFDMIKQSIKELGQLRPVTIDSDFNLIDGFTRDKILQIHKINTIRYNQYLFSSEVKKFQFIDSSNIKRRHLTNYQRFLASLQDYEKETIAAQKREKAGIKVSPEQKGRSTAKAAKYADMSKTQFENALYIHKQISEEKEEELITNKTKIGTVYSQLKVKNRKFDDVILPDNQYNVLEFDFPWGYTNQNIGVTLGGGGGSSNRQYPSIPPADILKNEVPKFKKIIADNAVIFMWVTTPLLNEIIQLKILEAMGFTYKTMITWHKLYPKEQFGGNAMGYWFLGETEHCLVGVRGNIPPFKCKLPNFIEAPTEPHSQKPLVFKKLFEEATKNIPGRKMFEGYARTHRKDWTGFGNQLTQKEPKIKEKSAI